MGEWNKSHSEVLVCVSESSFMFTPPKCSLELGECEIWCGFYQIVVLHYLRFLFVLEWYCQGCELCLQLI